MIAAFKPRVFVAASLCIVAAVTVAAARADIYQWEYVDPTDPSQGKRQSTVLANGGADVTAVPGANLQSRDLTMAYLHRADLSQAKAGSANFTRADLSDARLENVDFSWSTLTDADFTGAFTSGASFATTTWQGFTAAQLYSTASYQQRNLTRINLGGNRLSGWSFAEQNLTQANFGNAILEGASFRDANLANAKFYLATWQNADFTGADVRQADFKSSNLSLAQLYSTATYQAGDLAGIRLDDLQLTGANFGGMNLTKARFADATLSNADLSHANLASAVFQHTKLPRASLTHANASGANFYAADFYGADLSHANLSGAFFEGAKVTSANFTGADVRQARLAFSIGFTFAQLSSTANYQARDLRGVTLDLMDLARAEFSGQSLGGASFWYAKLKGANFANADVRGTSFAGTNYYGDGLTPAQLYATASYQSGDLTKLGLGNNVLRGWNFVGQNLTRASFGSADLRDADLTGAVVRGASFSSTTRRGFVSSQLYSTSSYVNRDLREINFGENDLAGWSFAGQRLTNALFLNSKLVGADFTNADTRGALGMSLVGSIRANTILPDGRIEGLDLSDGRSLTIRDYHGGSRFSPTDPPASLPLLVEQYLTMNASGSLRLRFEDAPWDSLIRFAPGIPVTLGDATLDLDFDSGVDVSQQFGRTIQVFDWTGVVPIGQLQVVSPYKWDASRLYTSGQITLIPEPTSLVTGLGLAASLIAMRRRRLGATLDWEPKA
jgi:uncharacterized protein YjbI with pentapeptide repeats